MEAMFLYGNTQKSTYKCKDIKLLGNHNRLKNLTNVITNEESL